MNGIKRILITAQYCKPTEEKIFGFSHLHLLPVSLKPRRIGREETRCVSSLSESNVGVTREIAETGTTIVRWIQWKETWWDGRSPLSYNACIYATGCHFNKCNCNGRFPQRFILNLPYYIYIRSSDLQIADHYVRWQTNFHIIIINIFLRYYFLLSIKTSLNHMEMQMQLSRAAELIYKSMQKDVL